LLIESVNATGKDHSPINWGLAESANNRIDKIRIDFFIIKGL